MPPPTAFSNWRAPTASTHKAAARYKENMTRRTFATAAVLPSLLSSVTILLRAQGAKKTYTFHGKIESLDAASKSMTVNGEKVEGWMGAMTMKYEVDNADVFKAAKV